MHAEFRQCFDSRYVARFCKRLANGYRSFELAVVVAGRVSAKADGSIDDRVVRPQAIVHCRGIDEWFKGRTRLSHGLSRAVEFTLIEVIAADHCLDLSGLRLNRNETCLDFGLLFQRDLNLTLGGIHRANHKHCHIAAFENLRSGVRVRPRDVLRREHSLVPANFDGSAAVLGQIENDAGNDIVCTDGQFPIRKLHGF